MGGRNHQPCRIYLGPSTRYSRSLSLARVELELANVSLEDVLLAELAQGAQPEDDILRHLSNCAAHLRDAMQHGRALRLEMKANKYQELPSVRKLNLRAIGDSLAKRGAVDSNAWSSIEGIRLREGFSGILSHFERQIECLIDEVEKLQGNAATLHTAFVHGTVNIILEENKPRNLRPHFARLYTAFSRFEEQFLASALLSAESWYAFNGYPLMSGVLHSAVGVE